MEKPLFLVLREFLATYDVEGEPPNGRYGTDWIVVRTSDRAKASAIGMAVMWDGDLAAGDGRMLDEERARMAFQGAASLRAVGA